MSTIALKEVYDYVKETGIKLPETQVQLIRILYNFANRIIPIKDRIIENRLAILENQFRNFIHLHEPVTFFNYEELL